MKSYKTLLAIVLCLALVQAVYAQGTTQDTGTIRGTIKDTEGNPLPGVTITAASPAIMGTQTAVTNETGTFRLTLLRVGVYSLTAALQGFQTIKRENVLVGLNATVTLNMEMTPTKIEEQVTVVAASPVVDVKTSTQVKYFKSDLLQNIPIARDLGTIVTLAPGVVSAASVKGGTAGNTIYHVDGLYANDPDNAQLGANVDFNMMEEVEIATGGYNAEIGSVSGGYINAITKSGGNKFSGLFQGYYNQKDFTTVVVPQDQLTSMGLGLPTVDRFNYDLSGSFGGPIFKDKLWFFTNGRFARSARETGFVNWTSPLGIDYKPYEGTNWNWGAMAKFTFQPMKNLRITFNGNLRSNYRNTRATGLFTPYDCAYTDDPWSNSNVFGSVTWIIDPNTFLEVRGGFLEVSAMLVMPSPSQSGLDLNKEQINYDNYTGYYFGTGYRTNEWIGRPTIQTSAHLTRFQDNFLGGDHEFKAGFEINTVACNWSDWKDNPLRQEWYNGNPYYWRGLYGLNGPDAVHGDGRISLFFMGTTRENSMAKSRGIRYSGYLQDSFTIKNRLTINVGLRYDYTRGWIPDYDKGPTGGFAQAVGATTMLPDFGINLYGEWKDQGVDPFTKFGILAPRLGLTYDLFGDGKTALRLHVGRFSDWLYASFIVSYNPLRLSSYSFDWWDDNLNGVPDSPPTDHYKGVWGTSPLVKLRDYWSRLVDTNLKATYDDQIVLGIDHELFTNFKVSVSYMYKKKNNIIDDALFDFSTNKRFDYPDSGYWVPFTTTIPKVDQFPAQTVTMYYLKKSAPQLLNKLMNIPEAYRKYSGLDIIFDKRFAHGWQIGGSVTISKTWGNIAGDYGNIWGYSLPGNNANWYVNNEGRLSDGDRPLVMKFYGTFNIPYGFLVSFYYNYYSGSVWQRSATVYAPAAWAAANDVDTSRAPYYGINFEPQGTRRTYNFQNVDARLEKDFSLGKYGTFSAYIDIYNLFGNFYPNVVVNPGGSWRPTDNNVTTGTYAAASTYKRTTSLSNMTRVFRLSLRYAF